MGERRASPDRPTDPFARYRNVGNALALAVLLVGAVELCRLFVTPQARDFVSFWGAAKLAIAGTPALAYDPSVLHQVQGAVASFGPGEQMPFPYLPAYLVLAIPFAFLPYPLAMALWILVGLSLYALALRRLVPEAGLLALAFPPVLVNIAVGQNGFLTAALFFAAMAALPRRGFVAGLLLGCLILKPQLGLVVPVALLASREWRAIAGAATSAVAIFLIGFLLFGAGTTLAWIHQLPLYASIGRDGMIGWEQLTSVYAAARQAGLGEAPAFALHLAVAAAATLVVWRVWRTQRDLHLKASVLACATTLASPYLFLYDQLVLVLPLLWLARNRTDPAIVGLLWCLPMLSIAQHYGQAGPVNLNAAVPILLLAILVRRNSAAEPESLPLETTALAS